MITLEACPNCESDRMVEFRTIPGGKVIVEITQGVKVDAVIVTKYFVCQDCKLIFQNPRMSDAELDIYYGSGHYRKTINQPPGGMDKSEKDRAVLDAAIIKKYLTKVKSHLDVGCGHGYLLKAVDADLKVGIESDPNYVTVKTVKVYPEMEKVPQKSFDLVTAIHVLEHVSDPAKYLRTMAKFVKKGKYLVIEVPSLKTRGGPLGFAHLFYFEPDILRFMCKQAGLQVVDVEFTPHLVMICKSGN